MTLIAASRVSYQAAFAGAHARKMMRLISGLALVSAAVEAAITPGDYASFVIDHDVPAAYRYQKVYEHFEEPLSASLDYWWNSYYTDEVREWFTDNIDELSVAQPEAFEAMQALADFLGLEVTQTFGVNLITELSTWCTSIVSQTADGGIAHVRNLDFFNTEVMKQLVYN